MRPRSDSAPEARTPADDASHAGLDNDALVAALRADCQRAAVTYVNNVVTDRPDSVASCTFYRAGTLVVTRPEAIQVLPRHIDAPAGLSAEEVVVSRKAAADRVGTEHYDLVHVVGQPAVRVLFVHVANASDALVRAAAVAVVNEDAEKNATAPEEVAAVGVKIVPPRDDAAAARAGGEFEVVVLDDAGRPPRVSRRESEKRVWPPTGSRHSDHDDDCAADDLEGGEQGDPPVDESAVAGLSRRCVLL